MHGVVTRANTKLGGRERVQGQESSELAINAQMASGETSHGLCRTRLTKRQTLNFYSKTADSEYLES